MGKATWILLIGGIVTAYVIYSQLATPLDEEEPIVEPTWFGHGEPQIETDTSIREFKIKVSDKTLKNLKTRINKTRWGEGFVNDFSYGMRVDYMKEVAEYWATKYDWRKQESILNSFPQFKTKIEGIDVHFLHVKPTNAKVVHPIMIIHGWPGSILEFYKVIPLLTEGSDEAYEVICPSIPGYGFSEPPHQPGFSQPAAARIFNTLMQRLGHKTYYLQGGDWGSFIATIMAQRYPQNILGVHLNMFSPGMYDSVASLHQLAASFFPSLFLKEEERERFTPTGKVFEVLLKETGYAHIQATKPDTLAFGLNDSPVGLAAYILEKFSVWTNPAYIALPDGGLTKHYTLDELLTNVMIYWTTETIASSVRFYKEVFLCPVVWKLDSEPVTVPSGLALFPNEIVLSPETIAAYKFKNIVQFTYMPRGGHFAAFEEPKLLADDIKSFVRKVQSNKIH